MNDKEQTGQAAGILGDHRGGTPVVIRSRLLCCPLQDLEQDVGCCVTPSYKVAEVVKILRSDKLQQLNLHITASMLWQHFSQGL